MTQFPDFAKVAFDALPAQPLQTGEPWQTPEGIAVRPAYGPADTT
jgi:methylmalonyl-CoA mutase